MDPALFSLCIQTGVAVIGNDRLPYCPVGKNYPLEQEFRLSDRPVDQFGPLESDLKNAGHIIHAVPLQ